MSTLKSGMIFKMIEILMNCFKDEIWTNFVTFYNYKYNIYQAIILPKSLRLLFSLIPEFFSFSPYE